MTLTFDLDLNFISMNQRPQIWKVEWPNKGNTIKRFFHGKEKGPNEIMIFFFHAFKTFGSLSVVWWKARAFYWQIETYGHEPVTLLYWYISLLPNTFEFQVLSLILKILGKKTKIYKFPIKAKIIPVQSPVHESQFISIL